MSETIRGRNCKIEVALTFYGINTPTGVSKAYPPVVQQPGHFLSDGMCGYWTVPAGMVELDLQAFMVNNKTTNAFEMPGLDTTDYDPYVTGGTPPSGFIMAETWGTLVESAGWEVGGGAADQREDTRLHEGKRRNVSVLLQSQDVTITIRNQMVNGPAMSLVERSAKRDKAVLFRISKYGTVLRVFYGTPSLPGEAVASGDIANGQFVVSVPQWAIKPNV